MPKLLIGSSQIILLSAQCSYPICNIVSILLTSQTYQLNFVSVVRTSYIWIGTEIRNQNCNLLRNWNKQTDIHLFMVNLNSNLIISRIHRIFLCVHTNTISMFNIMHMHRSVSLCILVT